MNVLVVTIILFSIIGVCIYVYSKQSTTSTSPTATPIVQKDVIIPISYPNVTTAPSTYPSTAPSSAPTTAPYIAPTTAPYIAPTAAPTTAPYIAPSSMPTPIPTSGNFMPTYTPPPKIDCTVSAWSDAGSCSGNCGGGSGTKNQSRTVVTQSANGGAACPSLTQSVQCTNTTPCPVDCVVSAWSDTSSCSGNCGGGSGTKNQSRTVVTQSANGGAACPSLTQSVQCTNTTPCPVDCVVSGWSDSSACSVTCGGGTKTQTRTVTKAASNGGAACPPLTQSVSCNTQPCPPPVDCQVTDYTDDSDVCSGACGGGIGTIRQLRRIDVPAANGGAACPPFVANKSCKNGAKCPINCVGAWGDWGPCSSTTGKGTQTRTYKVSTTQQYGGNACSIANGAVDTQSCCGPGLAGPNCQYSPATCNNSGTPNYDGSCNCSYDSIYRLDSHCKPDPTVCADGYTMCDNCNGGQDCFRPDNCGCY